MRCDEGMRSEEICRVLLAWAVWGAPGTPCPETKTQNAPSHDAHA
jgi:hypothetical protein